MFTLKAFATNSLFIDNTENTVSIIGELSTQSLTYARDKGFYKSINIPNIDLVTFTSNLDNAPYILTSSIVDSIIIISNFIYNAAITAGTELFSDVLINGLLNTFPTIANNFNTGNIVSDGEIEIPEWVSWTSINNVDIGIENEIKIWFVDNSFQVQYDDYEIVVIPPMLPLDNFFLSVTNITSLLSLKTLTLMMDDIQNAKNGYPETIITGRRFDFIDPTNVGNVVPTTWYLLLYGAAGNNIDIIKNALATYILQNSTHTQEQWTRIFPSIFKTTEFTIIPNWTKYSIPNMVLQAGIYSPVIKLSDAIAILTNNVPNYPREHILNNADVFSQPYKALTLLCVGSPDNENEIYSISEMFPDFIDVSSTSVDFARMSQVTQDWAMLLASMIVVAESMVEFSTIPLGMSKVTRNGILYLVSKFQNINYLVASKSSIKNSL